MSSGACIGCVYEKGGKELQEHGPVILCSGGFGADFTQESLLAKFRPDLMHLPTTNGEHCTGDGIKMGDGIKIGRNSLLDCVVFGRVAGLHATKYIMGNVVPTSLDALSGGGADKAGSELRNLFVKSL